MAVRAHVSRSVVVSAAICSAAVWLESGCGLSHTPLQNREQKPPIITPPKREKGVEDVEELRKSRPVLRRSRPKKATWPDAEDLDAMARDLKAEAFRIDDPCVADDCPRASLDRVFAKLEQLEDSGQGTVRILHLGDSHVAADYITGTVRKALQYRFKNAGRGFVAIDQRAEYGGRRFNRDGWIRRRAVDKGYSRDSFGFAAMSLDSTRSGASVEFKLDKDDAKITVFYRTSKLGSKLEVRADDKVIGELDARNKDEQTRSKSFSIPASLPHEKLSLIADGPNVKLFGVSFEADRAGLFYDSVGPVGADARVYLSLDRKSFKEHLRELAPDLIVIMLGGNDALAMRKGIRTLDDVRSDHEKMILALREAYPEADCMMWSPMDAAEMVHGKMVSKKFLSEVRNMQKAAASKMGCAFWDMFESMGGEESFARWHRAGIMNDDLVHPRMAAGELLGHLFSTAFLNAYGGED